LLRRIHFIGMDTATNKAALTKKYKALKNHLNEKSLRLCAAADAEAIGHGGVSIVSECCGMARNTIYAGRRDLYAQSIRPLLEDWSDRIRRPGGGRKTLITVDDSLSADLDRLVDPVTRGDPESPLRWTCKSTTRLAHELNRIGHHVSQKSVWTLLDSLGYSMQSNRKRFEGADHPDRDAQFQFIANTVQEFIRKKYPVISVDTKKKELVGNFKNGGSEWRIKGEPEYVNMHDFADKELGKVIPYGIYDIAQNKGWVSIGITHDTAEFAVQSIRCWWKRMGKRTYPDAKRLLVTADGGGSNGSRVRLWKVELQKLANDVGMEIRICHFPPGTSKWNKIEHRMFCHITENWRGRPLESHAVVVNLIANTTTAQGLKIKAEMDLRDYDIGKHVDDSDVENVNIVRNPFHGDWNYAIKPKA
jgi:hypothetical protein